MRTPNSPISNLKSQIPASIRVFRVIRGPLRVSTPSCLRAPKKPGTQARIQAGGDNNLKLLAENGKNPKPNLKLLAENHTSRPQNLKLFRENPHIFLHPTPPVILPTPNSAL
jgi:hypothetical protein